jgi:hypothetical protein
MTGDGTEDERTGDAPGLVTEIKRCDQSVIGRADFGSHGARVLSRDTHN